MWGLFPLEGNTLMAFTGNTTNVVLPSPKNLPTIGGLYKVPIGMAIPAAIVPVIPTTYSTAKLLGFISDAGIKFNESRPTTKIYAWGSDIVANPQTSFDETMAFALYEFLNPEAAKAAYGTTNVAATAADSTHGNRLSIAVTSDALDTSAWIVDTFSPGGKRIQYYIPLGQVTNKGTMDMNNKTVLSHDLTVEMFPDSNGKYKYILTDDGVLSA
jgi:hypothetical protein